MRGETVIVLRRVQTGVDEGNNPVYENVQESVGNVLVGSPNGENATDSTRPDGIQIDANLYFPATTRANRCAANPSSCAGLNTKWSATRSPWTAA